jgi:hypothetical protein
MKDFLVGALMLVIGAVFCFRGYLAMRIIIPIWGALFGFFVGAGMIEAINGDGFLRTALGWIVGLIVAVVFGAVAYLYYEVAVLLGMTAIGFSIGVGVLAALGVTWSWVLILAGIALGVFLAFMAIVTNLPMALLTFLTALAGASTMVGGVMLMVGTINLDDFDNGGTTQRVADNTWWYVLYVALAVVGVFTQIRTTDGMRASMRDAWSEDGGRHLRGADAPAE